MSKTTKYILLGVGVVLILLAFFVKTKSQETTFQLHWEYYNEYGSPDVIKLRAYEVSADSVIMRLLSDSINVEWTTHQFKVDNDNDIHYFVVTAVDSAGNESEFSNFGILDLSKPIKVRNVTITR